MPVFWCIHAEQIEAASSSMGSPVPSINSMIALLVHSLWVIACNTILMHLRSNVWLITFRAFCPTLEFMHSHNPSMFSYKLDHNMQQHKGRN